MTLTLPSWKRALRCVARWQVIATACTLLPIALFQGVTVRAQTIQPVVVEYKSKAAGRFEVTNNTLAPMAVVLEPRSFSVSPEGKPIYRPLDPTIHLDLSTMSFQIAPHQSYYVFYKAHADTVPAWFTVYAVLSSAQKEDGMKLRIMLPHTVYLYQDKPIGKAAIQIQKAVFLQRSGKVICDLENSSDFLVRVQEVRAVAGKASEQTNGFPLVPHGQRHVEIAWTQKNPPTHIVLHFPRFVVKEPLSVKDE